MNENVTFKDKLKEKVESFGLPRLIIAGFLQVPIYLHS